MVSLQSQGGGWHHPPLHPPLHPHRGHACCEQFIKNPMLVHFKGSHMWFLMWPEQQFNSASWNLIPFWLLKFVDALFHFGFIEQTVQFVFLQTHSIWATWSPWNQLGHSQPHEHCIVGHSTVAEKSPRSRNEKVHKQIWEAEMEWGCMRPQWKSMFKHEKREFSGGKQLKQKYQSFSWVYQ
jgi:hypothetical protein